MAEDSAPNSNVFFNGSVTNNHINLNFISVTNHSQSPHHHHHPTSNSRHSVLAFTSAALGNFLEIKYQGKSESPFETHPRTMYLAIASLILYSLAYDAKSRFISGVINGYICGIIMAVFGPLYLAALFSILLPELLCPILFMLSILFALGELLPLLKITRLWKWVREAMSIWVEDIAMQQQQQEGERSRRLMGVYPLLPLENILINHDEHHYNRLPV